jgi:hypothetical protein
MKAGDRPPPSSPFRYSRRHTVSNERDIQSPTFYRSVDFAAYLADRRQHLDGAIATLEPGDRRSLLDILIGSMTSTACSPAKTVPHRPRYTLNAPASC